MKIGLGSTAPLKNECVKAPGMTAPDGRGSIVKAEAVSCTSMWYLAILHHLGWAAGPWELPAVTARLALTI